MSRKVIEVRGRTFAIETRGIRMRLLLEHYNRRSDEQLDMYHKEYLQELEEKESCTQTNS